MSIGSLAQRVEGGLGGIVIEQGQVEQVEYAARVHLTTHPCGDSKSRMNPTRALTLSIEQPLYMLARMPPTLR